MALFGALTLQSCPPSQAETSPSISPDAERARALRLLAAEEAARRALAWRLRTVHRHSDEAPVARPERARVAVVTRAHPGGDAPVLAEPPDAVPPRLAARRRRNHLVLLDALERLQGDVWFFTRAPRGAEGCARRAGSDGRQPAAPLSRRACDSCVQSVGRKIQCAAEQLRVESPLASSHCTKRRVAGREFSTVELRFCGGCGGGGGAFPGGGVGRRRGRQRWRELARARTERGRGWACGSP